MDLRDLSVNEGSLTDDPVVVSVASDPEPQHPAYDFDTKRPVRKTDTRREETSHPLELQGWMTGIVLQQLEVLVRKITDRSR
jgi:hypothetical protein